MFYSIFILYMIFTGFLCYMIYVWSLNWCWWFCGDKYAFTLHDYLRLFAFHNILFELSLKGVCFEALWCFYLFFLPVSVCTYIGRGLHLRDMWCLGPYLWGCGVVVMWWYSRHESLVHLTSYHMCGTRVMGSFY